MSKKRDIYNEMDSEEQNDVYGEDYPSYYEEEDGVPDPEEEDKPADDPMQYPDDLEGAGYIDTEEMEREAELRKKNPYHLCTVDGHEVEWGHNYDVPFDFYYDEPDDWMPAAIRKGGRRGRQEEDYSSPSSSSETSSSESSSDSSSEEEEDDDSSDTSSSEEETSRGRGGRRKVTRRAKPKTGRKTMRSANRTTKKRASKKTNKKRR